MPLGAVHLVDSDRREGGAGADVAEATRVTGHDVVLSNRERRGVLAIADFIAGVLACVLAFVIHPGHLHSLPRFEPFAFGAIWVAALYVTDGYGFLIPTNRFQSGIAVVKAFPVALLLAVGDFFLRPYILNRPVILIALGIGSGLLILMRITAARLLLRESLAVRAVLLSDKELQPDIIATLRAARFECRVTATLIRTPEQEGDPVSLLRDLSRVLEQSHAHELIVTNNELRLVPGLAEECLTRGVRVVSGSDLVERYMGLVPSESVDVHWYLALPENDLLERPYALVRRLVDLLLSLVVSVPYLLLLPFLALAIRLESPGPIFLVQQRVGENGRPFDLYKLRTMTSDAESSGPALSTPADPRITRIGHILRATRLDEVPQLLNILRGEMSFIGPRPERPEFVALFERQVPHFRSRLLIKPGLTGWAQVKGGYASTLPEIKRKLEYDLYYIKNRSLRLDLQILGITLITVLRRGGR
jgi:exopolysaccharide biosynthesis polyprenyl glycosylphosphotransferase